MTEQHRFWQKVNKQGEDDCWPWVASVMWKGYGQYCLTKNGRSAPVRAHRYAWELTHGAIPDGQYVLHACDNRRCVNPRHLFLGTAKQNSLDMVRKGRQSRGPEHAAKIQAARGMACSA
jgi:hypothetical protein